MVVPRNKPKATASQGRKTGGGGKEVVREGEGSRGDERGGEGKEGGDGGAV